MSASSILTNNIFLGCAVQKKKNKINKFNQASGITKAVKPEFFDRASSSKSLKKKSRHSVYRLFIPRRTLVAGIMVSHWPSVCLSVRTSIHTSFPFDNLSIYKQISFKFYICICTNNVSLGIVNGRISIIYQRVMAFFNVQKMVFGLWFIYCLEYQNETSQK